MEQTHIFFSASCADCWTYTEEVLVPTVQSQGIVYRRRTKIHGYINPDERAYLIEMAEMIGLPRSIADSLYAFVPTAVGFLVVLGHVPSDLIAVALTSPDLPPYLVL